MDSRNLTTKEAVAIAVKLWIKAFTTLKVAKKHFGNKSMFALDFDPGGANHIWTVSGPGIKTQKVVIQNIV